ncbi:stage III sporulation protein SpoIIIAB [Alkalihalophilus lindianensis]|uniref:Stage III sporulation protein SpoIIIAB n=1 Tax=Alkalihalophilus lindianensis TaxID=1630542 RepID=A0ABU3XB73_9BACI|nr:stage III sporulation protein SpoIIIAB [Alkalihalophilus lindianensis]MDV2685137.1 stage III sporulation protein SpoIIIAB [Alkalihalophilus lindianensis]
MKLLGALLIIIVTTAVGFELARRLSERPRQLRQLKVAIQSLEAEILYGLTPLAQASKHLAKQTPKPICYLFEHFAYKLKQTEQPAYVAWEESIKEMWSLTSLLQNEQEILKQFGQTLGQHDREQQQKQIKLTLAHLEREEGEARDRQHRYERMVKSLGFLTGLLIVILLM